MDRALPARPCSPSPTRRSSSSQTFADQAVIAIENVRLFDEVEARTRTWTEALRADGNSEILQVIASSPTEIKPVLKAIAESAARSRCHDAVTGLTTSTSWSRRPPRAGPDRLSTSQIDRAGRGDEPRSDGPPVHVQDGLSEAATTIFPRRSVSRRRGHRTILAPAAREGEAIGSYHVAARCAPLQRQADRAVEDLADQAVIAIENARLFEEVQAKTPELSSRCTTRPAAAKCCT